MKRIIVSKRNNYIKKELINKKKMTKKMIMKIQLMKLKINLIVLYVTILQKPLYSLMYSLLIGLALRLFCWKVLLFCDEPPVIIEHEADLSGQQTIEVLSKSEQVYCKRERFAPVVPVERNHEVDVPVRRNHELETDQETIEVLSKSKQAYCKGEICKPVPTRVYKEILRLPKLPKIPELPKMHELPTLPEAPKMSELPKLPETPQISESDSAFEFQQNVFAFLDVFEKADLSIYPSETHKKLVKIQLTQTVIQDCFPTPDDIKKLIKIVRTTLDLSNPNDKIKLRVIVASIMTADSIRSRGLTDSTQILLLYHMFESYLVGKTIN